MKANYIVLGMLAVMILGGGLLFFNKTTSKTTPVTKNTSTKNETAMKDEETEGNVMGLGYVMKNGAMMIEENSKFRAMTENVMLKDGTVVTTAGQVTKKDGSTFTLTEGQSMWTDGTFMKEEAMMKDDGTSGASALSSRYIDYSQANLAKVAANNGKAVLWFAALKWCPSCQAADRDFKAHFDKVPEDITILKVDYDRDSAMKQKYAITMQDTFVQVDNQGKEVTRWNSGGQGIQALLANAK